MKCSVGISNFLEEISSLSHSIVFLYFFALITEDGFAILWNSAFKWVYLSFFPLLFASLLFKITDGYYGFHPSNIPSVHPFIYSFIHSSIHPLSHPFDQPSTSICHTLSYVPGIQRPWAWPLPSEHPLPSGSTWQSFMKYKHL